MEIYQNCRRSQHSFQNIFDALIQICLNCILVHLKMLSGSKEEKMIDFDERKNPLMTTRTVKYYCQKEGLFTTPELNDKLYLQYKGFLRIVPQTLSQYHSLVALWLNNNGISKIEGLNNLINLTSLALNNNSISKIEGLDNLINLSILNISNNKIEVVDGLDSLRKLETINLAHNFITTHKAIRNLKVCEQLSTIDLSENQLECTQETFEEILNNKNVACLYLKSTPISRGFKNYRKRLIAALRKLKFLDDRPVLEQDHRLAEAWTQGGLEFERQEKQRLAEEKLRAEQEQKQAKVQVQSQQAKRPKPEGFIASIKDTSIRIMNIDDEQQEARIIAQYFEEERKRVQKNIQKQKQEELQQIARSNYYQEHETEVITDKVNEILGKANDANESEEQNQKLQRQINKKWNEKYQKLLETLLLRYKFDFSEVQPSLNMILADICKKVMRTPIRFQIDQLRKIWTDIQRRKRSKVQSK